MKIVLPHSDFANDFIIDWEKDRKKNKNCVELLMNLNFKIKVDE